MLDIGCAAASFYGATTLRHQLSIHVTYMTKTLPLQRCTDNCLSKNVIWIWNGYILYYIKNISLIHTVTQFRNCQIQFKFYKFLEQYLLMCALKWQLFCNWQAQFVNIFELSPYNRDSSFRIYPLFKLCIVYSISILKILFCGNHGQKRGTLCSRQIAADFWKWQFISQ